MSSVSPHRPPSACVGTGMELEPGSQVGAPRVQGDDWATRAQIPKATRLMVGHGLTFEVRGFAVRP
jgi:hypothetical protein